MNDKTSIEQLQDFLSEMFQFDANDLDFGIYKIYKLKRDEIFNFIYGKDEFCLEPFIQKTLDEKKGEDASRFAERLKKYLENIRKPLLANDIPGNYQKIKQLLIDFEEDENEKKFQIENLENAMQTVDITDEIKDKIYNHILGFFEMYYSNGDFGYNNRSSNIYKVGYEADYNGSDTLFHWKHKDSIYIKTGNSFNAIKFKIDLLDKEFELRLEASENCDEKNYPQNNNKDIKVKHYKYIRHESKNEVIRLIFNLSDESTTKSEFFERIFKEVLSKEIDLKKYLFYSDKGEQKPVFNNLIDNYDKVENGSVIGIGALRISRDKVLKKVKKSFERTSAIAIDPKTGKFTDEILETLYTIDQKLNTFYIGNDSDYFIHENLNEFLVNEKERYIKNHILSDLKSILDGRLDNITLVIAKAFDSVTSRIIEFLSAIEEFQKKLYTMKKKVVECEYCLTIDNIDKKFYKEILNNKDQIKEWENLFSIKVNKVKDLQSHPTLVLDTKNFRAKDGSNTFKDKIIGTIDNLDEKVNGLLILQKIIKHYKFFLKHIVEKLSVFILIHLITLSPLL